MRYLRQSTATSVIVGPFVDDVDGKTPETGLLAADTDLDFYKGITKSDITDTDSGGNNDIAHIANGNYSLELTTTDTNTLGQFRITINATGALPVWHDFTIVPANVYDALILGTDLLEVDTTQLGGTAQTARDIGASVLVGDKTGFSLSTAGIQAIWDALTSALTTVGSIGKRLVDNIDAAISSRSTYAGADTPGTGTLLSRIGSALTITGGKVDVNDKTGFSLTVAYPTTTDTNLIAENVNTILASTVPVVAGAVSDLSPSASAFTTDVSGPSYRDNQFADQRLHFIFPSTNYAEDKPIASYNATTGEFTFDEPFTIPPIDGDLFIIVPDHVHPVSQIAGAVLDEPLAGHATAGTLGASLTSLLNRIGAFTGNGVNTIFGFFKALMSKTASTPSDVGGTFDPATDSTEAIRDRGDAAWTGGGGGDDPWATDLSADTYNPGEAGYILFHNLDAQVSELVGGPATSPNFASDCAEVQRFDEGEKKPVAVRFVIKSGTFSISSATITLKDGDGTTVYGINAVSATGYDAGALTSPRVWYLLNTVSPPSGGPIATGTYEAEFTVIGTTSDAITRTMVKSITVVVE